MTPAQDSSLRPTTGRPSIADQPPPDGAGDCRCGHAAAAADAELVAGCLRGDAASWEALVRRYQRLVYAIVRRMEMDEHTAADVFQTVFARLLTELPRIAEPARLQAWIVTTARREALLQLRRSRRTVSMTSEADGADDSGVWDVPDGAPLAPDALDLLQQLDLVRHGLEQLDPRCRGLIDMLFNDDDTRLGYSAIASRLNIAVGSIGATRARCLEKLRRLLVAR